ncbi:MAG: alpha/beta fold hydrolase [Thermomicrobiales bacterium]
MATYVLVGGAWLGGWAWQGVARPLRERGHDVYPATLTGLGDRVHLARPEIDLETHITDVVNLIGYEDLTDVILVGHSYSSMVVTGVADRVPDRLAHLVYLDGAPFEDGEALVDFNSPEGKAEQEQLVHTQGDGWKLPVPSNLGEGASIKGLGDAELAFFARHATAQPFATFTQPLRLTNAPASGDYGKVIIACDDFRDLKTFFPDRSAQFVPPTWRMYELDTGHWPMLSMPHKVTEILHELAAA